MITAIVCVHRVQNQVVCTQFSEDLFQFRVKLRSVAFCSPSSSSNTTPSRVSSVRPQRDIAACNAAVPETEDNPINEAFPANGQCVFDCINEKRCTTSSSSGIGGNISANAFLLRTAHLPGTYLVGQWPAAGRPRVEVPNASAVEKAIPCR
jgi:hypothetical protein